MIRVGVMGSASGPLTSEVLQSCRKLGEEIAKHKLCLLTGACPGLPQEVVLGAKQHDGHVIGISPAKDLTEHLEVFESPCKEYDVLIYTGLGMMVRELINLRSSDFLIFVGGRSGTLGEFAIAFEEGKLIGLLANSGGVSDSLLPLVPILDKGNEAEVVSIASETELVNTLIERFLSRLRRSSQVHPFADELFAIYQPRSNNG